MSSPQTALVHPLHHALGALVDGMKLSGPDMPQAAAVIAAALEQHLVVLVRGRSLEPCELVNFSRHFGKLQMAPPSESHASGPLSEYPEIYVISNIHENGNRIGTLGNSEAEWHTDMSYEEIPPEPTILHAKEVTRSGGETSLCNMYLAYESLPSALQKRADTLLLKHDASYTSAGDLRQGADRVQDPRTAVGAAHPLVRQHPRSGRKALYLGRRRNAWLVGLPLAESEALLDELWQYAALPEHVWTHAWQVGDILLWDNRWTMHHRSPFDDNERRLMIRTQVLGEKPVPATLT